MKLINDKMIVDLTDSLGLKFMDEKDRNEILMGVLELVGKNAGVRIIEEFTDEKAKIMSCSKASQSRVLGNYGASKH